MVILHNWEVNDWMPATIFPQSQTNMEWILRNLFTSITKEKNKILEGYIKIHGPYSPQSPKVTAKLKFYF